MKASSSMISFLLLLLPTLSAAQQTYFTNVEVNKRAVPCPEDPNQIGYKTITDINVDQRTELERIANGGLPLDSYVFPFCNTFKYLIEVEKLEVLLDNVIFVCGYNGLNSEVCVLEGGSNQVNIGAGQVTNVVFQGLSFHDFTGNSIQAYGTSSSTATFNDVVWQGFSGSATAIHQSQPQSGAPMQVVVNTASFNTGVGSNLIDNVGGTLTVNDLDVTEAVTADSVIRTSESGVSALSNFRAAFSNIVRMTHTRSGSRQTVNGITVSGMESMGTVLFVEGSGSILSASTVKVDNNMLFLAYSAQTSRNFNVIVATDSATAEVQGVEVTNCDGVDRVFSANDGATVSIADATVSNLVGTSPPDLLSNIGIAEDGGSLNLLRVETSNIEAFSAVYFATCGSAIQAVQCCVSNAKLSTSAFISAGSSFSGSGNYVETSTTEVTTCRDNPNLLVFKESSGESSCFSNTGTGVCEGDCATGFSDAGSCGISGADLEMSPVASPGAAAGSSCPASPPTPVPTLAPGVSPGSIASVDNGQTGITEKPVFSNTLPPGQPGGSDIDGNGPSSGNSYNDASSGSSGSSGSSNNGGGGSAAATPNSFGPMFAAALVVLGMLI